MLAPQEPADEIERLRSLYATGLLDSAPDEAFDRLTRLARSIVGSRICLISLVDHDRQWFKSRQGLDAEQTPREISFCGHAILSDDILEVPNASQDERFADNPLVTGDPNIRFYAGAPLHGDDGFRIGTLCVIDDKPHVMTAEQRASLRDIADCIEEQIRNRQHKRFNASLQSLIRLSSETDASPKALLRRGLALGCELLGMPFGIISHIRGNDYEVLLQVSPENTLEDGQHFELGDTYCSVTLAQGQMLTIDHMGRSSYSGHPCYRAFSLESYIGTAMTVAGKPYGTLNFSSPDPRVPAGFSDTERDFIQLLADWMVEVLDRWQGKDLLKWQEQMLAAITRSQANFIREPGRGLAFNGLLADTVALTGSQAGLIAEVHSTLHTDDLQLRTLYACHANSPTLEPVLEAQISTALCKAFTASSSQQAAQALWLDNGGPETGKPAVRTLLGIPVIHKDRLVALIGLVDNAEGYSDELIGALAPVTGAIEQLLDAARAQEQRLDTERRLQSVIESTRIGTWEWNLLSDTIVMNERMLDIVGYRSDEVPDDVRGFLRELLHPDDLQRCDEVLRQHFTGELDDYDVVVRLRHKAGHWVWAHERGRVMRWTLKGEPMLMAGTRTDITEKKTADIALQDNEARYRALFELSPVGIALNDYETGVFIDVNDALLLPSGYSRSEFLGLSYWDTTPKEYEADEQRQLDSLNKTGRYGPFEKEYIRKDGSRYPVLLQGMLLEDLSGRKMIWSIIEDITEPKRLVRMQQEFVATVSHELRTPLTAIAGALGLVEKGVAGVLPDRARDMVTIAYKNSERLSHLIDDLLDMEKLVAGKMRFELRSCDIMTLIQDGVAQNSSYADQYGVQVVVTGDAGNARIAVDVQRFQQVLANLLSNAIKFSEGGGVVTVTVSRSEDKVRMEVIDGGAGIPAEFLDRIFNKFSQADASDSRRKGGTGLGLAICKELVERMSGTIGFDSELGRGSVFYVAFPVASSMLTPVT
ncbi:PAS domain S-box protein [Marinobacter sp. 1Y8]